MEALVRRGLQSPDQALRLLGVARAICVGLSRSLPALAASAEQFAEQYPKLKLKVNGREVTVPEGTSVLNACREAGAYGERRQLQSTHSPSALLCARLMLLWNVCAALRLPA